MPDLHERLTAAVNARLEVARAAGTRWTEATSAAVWRVEQTDVEGVYRVIDGDECWVATDIVGEEVSTHIAANDAATVIRHCERDLRVLERHAEWPDSWGSCSYCLRDQMLTDWPCDEIRDLAAAYGVEVDDA